MKKLILLLFIPYWLIAQIPNYYIGIDFTKTGTELEQELSALVIATHTHELIYTPEVWDALLQTDLVPENQNKVFLVYGFDDNSENNWDKRTREKEMSCHTSNCEGLWVREHVFPKSLGTPPLGTEGAGSDAHNIRAIDSQENNKRSNRKFADGSGHSFILSNGMFYPGDEWKGDVARMIMYMQIRYPSQTNANSVGSGSNTYSVEMPDIFLDWNAEDPPSAYELVRNTVLENMQGNRNPFIDNPFLATLIWGGSNAINNWPNMITSENEFESFKIYPNPVRSFLNFKSEKIIDSVSLYTTNGELLKGNIKLDSEHLDLSNFENGSYILLIRFFDKTIASQKIIIKR